MSPTPCMPEALTALLFPLYRQSVATACRLGKANAASGLKRTKNRALGIFIVMTSSRCSPPHTPISLHIDSTHMIDKHGSTSNTTTGW